MQFGIVSFWYPNCPDSIVVLLYNFGTSPDKSDYRTCGTHTGRTKCCTILWLHEARAFTEWSQAASPNGQNRRELHNLISCETRQTVGQGTTPMTIFAAPLAFIPAAGFLAFRAFLKAYPSASTEDNPTFLLTGLKLGATSAAALPAIYIVGYIAMNYAGSLTLLRTVGNLPWLLLAIGGNVLNVFALISCLRERTGASMLAGFLLVFLQLCWMFTALSTLVYRDF